VPLGPVYTAKMSQKFYKSAQTKCATRVLFWEAPCGVQERAGETTPNG
jgi:hypothetical protein